jgi:hypothetical protein
MNNWDVIVASTKVVLEDVCSTLTDTPFKRAEQRKAEGLASSIFHGAYFIRNKGGNNVNDSVNGRLIVDYSVTLELCYKLTADKNLSYDTAMNDIEIVVRERLRQSSWTDYNDNIQYVKLNSVDEPKGTGVSEDTFITIPINFTFTMISLLNT